MAMAANVPEPGAAGERRRNRRKNIIGSQLLTVDVALGRTAAERQWQRGIVIDLSEVGMAIQPFLPLTQGTVGDIRIELPGDPKPVTSTGMVAWVGQGGRAGIRFIDVPASARDQLREWLSRNPRGAPQEEIFVPETPASNLPATAVEPAPVALLSTAPTMVHPEAVSASESAAVAETATPDSDREVDFQAALQLIAERAQLITSASGAAVAIGDSNGMVCRASTGTAPDVGAKLRPDSGLSGFCLQSGEIVYCADTQADTRVDATAARQLDLGSIIIVPVFVSGKLSGLLEVLSSHPKAFDDRQVIRLERFAELLGATVEEHQHSHKNATDDNDGETDEALKFTAATVPDAKPATDERVDTKPVAEENTPAVAPVAPPAPAFVFDSTLTAFPPAAPKVEPEAEAVKAPEPAPTEPAKVEVKAAEPMKPAAATPPATTEDLVNRVLNVPAVNAAAPEPAKSAAPTFLANPAEWQACKACGHKNPPWAQICENCHRDGKQPLPEPAPAIPVSAVHIVAMPVTEESSPTITEAPLFASAEPSGIRWSRVALILGIILLVALAGLAGLYLGRRARSEQAPLPAPSNSPASATISEPSEPVPAIDWTNHPAVAPQPAPTVSKAVVPVRPQLPKHSAKTAVKQRSVQIKTMWPQKLAASEE